MSDMNLLGGWIASPLNKIAKVKKGQAPGNGGNYIVWNGGVKPSGYTDKYNTSANSITISAIGSCGFVNFCAERFWCGGNCYALTDLTDSIDVEFLYHFLKAHQERIMRLRAGSGTPYIQQHSIDKFEVRYPPITEQKRIANILKTWDTAIEKTASLINAKERRFDWLVASLIDKSNDSWTASPLNKIAKVKKGEQLNRDTLEALGDYAAWNGGITPSGYTDKFNTSGNTITISEGGASCGFVNFCAERFWCGGHCYALTNLTDSIDVEFLYHFLKSRQKRIMRLRVGSGLPNIQKKDIDKFEVKYPPIAEQKRIVEILNTARQEIGMLRALVEQYRIQKRGLMQKLLSGEWQVKDKGAM